MTIAAPTVLIVSLLAAGVFSIATIGLYLHRQNIIMVLLCLELILIAVNLQILAVSKMYGDISGQVAVFFILTVAAAETSIGLALLILIFRNRSTISMEKLNQIKEL